jgi:serine/threonine-protein kinase ULK/ATG1
MLEIDETLNRDEIEYIFNKFDVDGDNKISFEDFKSWLHVNHVALNPKKKK